MVGARFGRFRVEEELGRGDFGVTYRLSDPTGGPELALKLAHAHLAQDDLFLSALERECVGLQGASHPGIATFGGLVREGGMLGAFRELVIGEDLRRVSTRSKVPIEQIPILLELCLRPLAHAHGRRLIHGDLGPTNLFWCQDGSVRITDFGLARAVHATLATRSGQVSGNLDYLAPEQAAGQLSPRSDLYALGLIVWECMMGRPACDGGDARAKLSWHRYQGMTDPREALPSCPDWLARLLLRMAAIDPATRFADASEALSFVHPSSGATEEILADRATMISSDSFTGLVPPPPPERAPPVPPRIASPIPEETVSTSMPHGFGGGGFGTGEGFGEAPEPEPAPGAAPRAQPPRLSQAPSVQLPRKRAVAPAARPPELDPRREQLKVAAFWSVALGVLLVSVVAFVGYRAIEARRLAAARAGGPDIDPELLVGGGFDRFATVEAEEGEGSGRGGSRGQARDRQGTDHAGTAPASGSGGERFLLGTEDAAAGQQPTLSVSSNPIGARVWLDNVEVGHTPLEGMAVKEGEHTVRLELDGYAWLSRRIEVDPGQVLELGSLDLDKEVVAAGWVLLWSVQLEGQAVFVDGASAGRLPVMVELTPGEHDFFVQPPSGEPVELRREVFPGTEQEPGRLQLEPAF